MKAISTRTQQIGRRASGGFTLVEMLLVLVILATLAAIVVPKMAGRGQQAKITAAGTQIENFKSVLDAFSKDCGRYPTAQEGLGALIKNPGLPGWKGPYLSGDIPLDPWGTQAYRYDLQDGRPHFVCAGPDGKFNTPDDIAADSTPQMP